MHLPFWFSTNSVVRAIFSVRYPTGTLFSRQYAQSADAIHSIKTRGHEALFAYCLPTQGQYRYVVELILALFVFIDM